MSQITLKAYAKINLSIDVLRKRRDGYHDVQMVLQQIELHDLLTIKYSSEDSRGLIHLSSDEVKMPLSEENIAWKAAKIIKEAFPEKSRGSIGLHIDKNIPMAAGLAGGSSDAAAVLHGLNQLMSLDLPLSRLMEMGVSLGADVPFCLMAQAAKDSKLNCAGEKVSACALAEGIGEKLTPLTPLKALVFLSKPDIAVSTAEIYGNLDLGAIDKHPDTDKLISALKREDFSGVSEAMYNVLEEVSVKKYPPIAREIASLQAIAKGAKVIMSGSGPTVFALFTEEKVAREFYDSHETKGLKYLVQTNA